MAGLLTLSLGLTPSSMLVIEPQARREVSRRRRSQKDWSVEDLRARSQLFFAHPSTDPTRWLSATVLALTRFPLDRPGWKPGGSGWESALGILFLPVFPPVPQLRVDEAPHEPGLDNTHQQQHAEPADRQGETDLRVRFRSPACRRRCGGGPVACPPPSHQHQEGWELGRLCSSTLQQWEVKHPPPRGAGRGGWCHCTLTPQSHSSYTYRSTAVPLPYAWPTGRPI